MSMQIGGNNNPFGAMNSFNLLGAQGAQMDPMMQAQLQMMLMAFMQQAMMQLFNMLFQGGFANQGCGGIHGGGGARGLPGGPGGVGGNFPAFNGNSGSAGAGALNAARSQLGVREATGRNDGLPANRYSNGRREPWCANFVAWSFRQAGTPLPGNQRSLASVQYMEDQMKANGMFHRGTPQPGDIIFFANRGGSDAGRGRHVGIVEKVENGRVHTIEGNSSNAVRRRSYALNNPRISGYGRVGGPAGTNPAAGVDPSLGTGRSATDRLFKAITGQESGGQNLTNPHSGALGIGQVMPANVRAWSKEALGYEISPQQFKNDTNLQRQIVHFKLNQYLQEGMAKTGNEREAVRYAAAKWYSGRGHKRNDYKPQYYNGHPYPSIGSYSDQVLNRFLRS